MKYWISRYFKVPLGTQVLLEDPYVLKYSYEYVKVQVPWGPNYKAIWP